jgi:hypothetical protein
MSYRYIPPSGIAYRSALPPDFLKEGMRRYGGSSTPPPVPVQGVELSPDEKARAPWRSPPIPPIYRPGTEKPKRRNWIWILNILIWSWVIWGRGHSDEPAKIPEPEVRRALPVEVRRAQLVRHPATPDLNPIYDGTDSPLIYDHHYNTTLLDKVTVVSTHYLGRFHSPEDLPSHGNYIGDMFAVGEGIHPHLWIWLGNPATWVDP